MENIILMSPLPPPYGGIAQWSTRYLLLCEKYNIKVEHVNESLLKERRHFGEKAKKSLFHEIFRCFKIWHLLIKKIRKSDKNSIIHCCIPAISSAMLREYISSIICKIYKRKFIIHFRSTLSQSVNSKFSKKILLKLLKNSNALIVLNSKSKDFLNSLGYYNCFTIPNFVDNREIFESRFYSEEIKQVLYVGMVTEEKGCKDIILFAKNFPLINFYLIGAISPGMKDVIKNKTDNVYILGKKPKEEINKYYLECDVFMFLSKFRCEGFSNALCEAMATGLPCIVSDWAANGDMICNYNKKLVIPPHGLNELFKAFSSLKNKNERAKEGTGNLRKTKELYNEDAVMSQYLKVYDFVRSL